MAMMRSGVSEVDVVVSSRRVEIDTSAPFQSVKEAVMLFGERVLAGEIYANRFKEIRNTISKNAQNHSRLESVLGELEETKQNLEKAQEESLQMANSLNALRHELEKTKIELKQIKEREHEKKVIETEVRDINFVEHTSDEFQFDDASNFNQEATEFQKKRYVTFANPPSLARVLNAEEQVFERQSSIQKESTPMKKKKKSFGPYIASLFTKKKGYQDGHALPNAQVY